MFREPNFRCKVSRDDGTDPFWRLCFAEDEDKARDYLTKQRLTVAVVAKYEFRCDWLKKAKNETTRIIALYEKGQDCAFEPYWGDLKDHLQDEFNHLCAYCEAAFRHVGYGDVEHYRPKGAVAEDKSHRGYYWLAYDPNNYLPSCQICNQYAKRDHFPISEQGIRAYGPEGSLEAEQALLINPLTDVYATHVYYVPSKDIKIPGQAKGITDKGKKTVDVMKLDRSDLEDRRRKEQDYVRLQVKQALFMEDRSALSRVMAEVTGRKQQFFSAASSEINDFYKTMGLPVPFESGVP